VVGALPAAKAMLVTMPLALVETDEAVDTPLELAAVEVALPLLEPPLLRPLLLEDVCVDEGLLVFDGVGLGVRVTVKRRALVTLPAELVTVIGPLPAPAGTMAVSCVSRSTLKNAARPLKLTDVAPVKPLPVRVTLPPTGPEVGVKLVSVSVAVGAGVGVGVGVEVGVEVGVGVGVEVGVGVGVASATIALAVMIAAPVPPVLLVVVVEPPPVLDPDELVVPPSPTPVAPFAAASVKSACTVSAMVPLAAVAVR
jgi:hypothetical protein